MPDDRIKLEPSWKSRIGDYLQRDDMQALSGFLRERHAAGARIFPPARQIFAAFDAPPFDAVKVVVLRSEEHTSELQSLMRISYAVFCLKKKNTKSAADMHIDQHSQQIITSQ